MKGFSKLKHLFLDDSSIYNDEYWGIRDVLGMIEKEHWFLQTLRSFSITNEARYIKECLVSTIVKQFPNLYLLDIAKAGEITDIKEIDLLAKKLPFLVELRLHTSYQLLDSLLKKRKKPLLVKKQCINNYDPVKVNILAAKHEKHFINLIVNQYY